MLIDTHCHLNFKAFQGREEAVIERANQAGVKMFIVPGTDLVTSESAVKQSQQYQQIFATVGLHPHHVYQYHQVKSAKQQLMQDLQKIKLLLNNSSVVGIGEVGIDKYYYRDTKYSYYVVDDNFVALQKQALVEQLKLALEYDRALVLHNRQGIEELLPLLEQHWDQKLSDRTVFHCCEADERLLDFAIKHRIYLGIDGDLSWSRKKQRFIANVPLNQLVLETDSPYLKPKLNNNWPKEVEYPKGLADEEYNEPKSIAIIRDLVACFKQTEPNEIEKHTTQNAIKLFQLTTTT